MKRGTMLLTLLLVLALMVGAYYGVTALVKKNETKQAEAESGASELLAVGDSETITAMSWTYLDVPVTLEKNENGEWICSDDESCPIDQSLAETLLSAATAVSGQLYVSGAEDLSEYGLDDPELTLTVTAGEESRSYAIGDYSDLAAMYYMTLDGGSDVYLESGSLTDNFWYDLENLVQFESAPEDVEQLLSLQVESDVQSYELEYSDDPLARSYSDDFRWFTETADAYRPLDTTETETLCGLVSGVSFTGIVTWNADSAALAQYGLTQPQATAELSYTDADGEEQSFTLCYGDYSDSGEVYVRIAGSSMVYLTDGSSLDSLMYADIDGMIPENLLSTCGASITAAEISRDGESYELDPAREEVQDFLEDLGTLTVGDNAAGAQGREEYMSLTLQLDSEAVPELEIKFYTYDSASTLCTVNDTSVFLTRTDAEALAASLTLPLPEETETETTTETTTETASPAE